MYFRFMILITVAVLVFATAGCDSKTDQRLPDIENSDEQSATTEFKVKKDADGKYWFVDPQGSRFVSIGINNVVPAAWSPIEGTDYYNAG